jgi:hypothetical protein
MELPAEVVCHVLSYGANRSWLGQMRRVCQLWRDLIDSTPSLWARYRYIPLPPHTVPLTALVLLTRGLQLLGAGAGGYPDRAGRPARVVRAHCARRNGSVLLLTPHNPNPQDVDAIRVWGAVPIGKVQLVRCSKALHHPITTLLTSPRGAMARSSLGEAGGGMGS